MHTTMDPLNHAVSINDCSTGILRGVFDFCFVPVLDEAGGFIFCAACG